MKKEDKMEWNEKAINRHIYHEVTEQHEVVVDNEETTAVKRKWVKLKHK